MSFDRIGLGTTDPRAEFHLVGNAIVQGNVTLGVNSVASNRLRVASSGNTPTLLVTQDGLNGIYAAKIEATTSVANGLHVKTLSNNPTLYGLWVEGRTADVVIDAVGNLGCGTKTPTQRLAVVGNATITGSISLGDAFMSNARVASLLSTTRIITTQASVAVGLINSLTADTIGVTSIVGSSLSVSTLTTTNGILSAASISRLVGGSISVSGAMGSSSLNTGILTTSTASMGGLQTSVLSAGVGFIQNINASAILVTGGISSATGHFFAVSIATLTGGSISVSGGVAASVINTGTITASAASVATIHTTLLNIPTMNVSTATVGNLTVMTGILSAASIATLTGGSISVSGGLAASVINTGFLTAGTTALSSLSVTGTTALSSLSVTGATTLSSLSVTGATLLQGSAELKSSLSVAGTAHFVSNLSAASITAARGSIGGGIYSTDVLTAGNKPGSSMFMRVTNTGVLAVTDIAGTSSLEIIHTTANSALDNNNNNPLLLNSRYTGNVGIGTTVPNSKLHVNGNFLATSATITGALSAASFVVGSLTVSAAINTTSLTSSTNITANGLTASTAVLTQVSATAIVGGTLSVGQSFVPERFGNNIGITGNLNVGNIFALGTTSITSDNTSQTVLGTTTNGGDTIFDTRVILHGKNKPVTGTPGTIDLIAGNNINTSGGEIRFLLESSPNVFATNMVIGKDGRVGVGTTIVDPGSKMAVGGRAIINGSLRVMGRDPNISAGKLSALMELDINNIVRLGSITGGDSLVGSAGDVAILSRGVEGLRVAIVEGGVSRVGIGIRPTKDTKFHVLGISRTEANGRSLQIVGTDHVYAEFYPRGFISQGVREGREGYIGFGATNSSTFTIMNERTGGDMHLGADGKIVTMIRNDNTMTVGFAQGLRGGILLTSNSTYGNPAVQSVSSTFAAGTLLLNPVGGNVGIGTNAPIYPLHVSPTVQKLQSSPYFDSSLVRISPDPPLNLSISIGAPQGYIFAHLGFVSSSDIRIKTNIHTIDDHEALRKLRMIEPKSYTYTDTVKQGSDTVFGFIAQDVQAAFPQAVKVISEFIPNIYRITQMRNGNEILLEGEFLKGGQRLKLICLDNTPIEVVIVQKLANGYYRLDTSIPLERLHDGTSIFVYGVWVEDFLTLKKDFLFTINFAATQELDREVQRLTAENEELKRKVDLIMQKLNV